MRKFKTSPQSCDTQDMLQDSLCDTTKQESEVGNEGTLSPELVQLNGNRCRVPHWKCDVTVSMSFLPAPQINERSFHWDSEASADIFLVLLETTLNVIQKYSQKERKCMVNIKVTQTKTTEIKPDVRRGFFPPNIIALYWSVWNLC